MARRQPSQVRSKETVATILEAATQVLQHTNSTSFTTNHIAQRAGVSIGSLYQYFDTKHDILQALADKHCQELEEVIMATLREELPPTVMFPQLIEAVVTVHDQQAATQQAVLANLWRLGFEDELRLFEERLTKALDAYLQRWYPGRSPLMAWLLVQTISLTHHWLDERDRISKDDFCHELQTLVLAYLEKVSYP